MKPDKKNNKMSIKTSLTPSLADDFLPRTKPADPYTHRPTPNGLSFFKSGTSKGGAIYHVPTTESPDLIIAKCHAAIILNTTYSAIYSDYKNIMSIIERNPHVVAYSAWWDKKNDNESTRDVQIKVFLDKDGYQDEVTREEIITLLRKIESETINKPFVSSIEQIVDQVMSDMQSRLAVQGINLEVGSGMKTILCEHYQQKQYTPDKVARRISSVLQKKVHSGLDCGNIMLGDTVVVKLIDGKINVQAKHTKHLFSEMPETSPSVTIDIQKRTRTNHYNGDLSMRESRMYKR